MLVNVSTALMALAALSAVQASPATNTKGKRSTTSNGVTCYYACPTPQQVSYGGNPCQSYIANSPSAGSFQYTCNGNTEYCSYDVGSGAFARGSGGIVCPAAASETCGGTQAGNQFKRTYKARRTLNKAERIIAERQYKPAKVAHSQ